MNDIVPRSKLAITSWLRDAGGMKYGCHKTRTLWQHPKLVFRDIVEQPTFWLDLDGSVVNGDCYWLTCDDPEQSDLLWLAAAVGNSTFIERFYDYRFNNKLYSGRRRFMTQYVEKFPLPDPHGTVGKKVIASAKSLYDAIPSEDDDSNREEINSLVWEAFGLVVSAGERVGDRALRAMPMGLRTMSSAGG